MGSKAKMDTATRQKCNKIIASAAAAAGLAGAAPIPLADTIPITAAQVGMVIALGKVFDLTISESAAKSVLSIMTAQTVGRAVFANVIKAIPGAGAIVGGVVASATAGAITTALGKIVSEAKRPPHLIDMAAFYCLSSFLIFHLSFIFLSLGLKVKSQPHSEVYMLT